MDENDIYIYTKRGRRRERIALARCPREIPRGKGCVYDDVELSPCEGVSTGTAIKLYQIRD